MDRSKRNKENYLRAKDAFNARNLDACLAHYAPNHQLMSKDTSAPASIRLFFETTIATWPDVEMRVEHAVAEDDWVMGRSIAVATHPATQRRVETTFWDLHRFDADGRIIESWSLMDALSIKKQIGSA